MLRHPNCFSLLPLHRISCCDVHKLPSAKCSSVHALSAVIQYKQTDSVQMNESTNRYVSLLSSSVGNSPDFSLNILSHTFSTSCSEWAITLLLFDIYSNI